MGYISIVPRAIHRVYKATSHCWARNLRPGPGQPVDGLLGVAPGPTTTWDMDRPKKTLGDVDLQHRQHGNLW